MTNRIGMRVRTAGRLLLLAFAVLFTAQGSAAAQSSNPFSFEKKAYKPDGTPWTGPVVVGDTIRYVLSYRPGAGASGPATIVDTLSPNLSYVAPTTASDAGWTWSGSPYSSGNQETYTHPALGPATIRLTVNGILTPSFDHGDGTKPIPLGNRVFGVYHHALTDAASTPQVDCWDLASLAKCGAPYPAPNSTGQPIATPMEPHAVVRGSKIFFVGILGHPPGIPTIGCFDTAANAPCADTPLTTVPAAGWADVGGLFEDPTSGKVFAAVDKKVFCREWTGTAWANCPGGWAAAGTDAITGPAPTTNYVASMVNVHVEEAPSPTRVYAHLGQGLLQCLDIATATPCAGWPAAGVTAGGGGGGSTFMSVPAGAGENGVCLFGWNGQVTGCVDASGAPLAAPANALPSLDSTFRVPGTGTIFFPRHGDSGLTTGAPTCMTFNGTAGAPCAGFVRQMPVPEAWTYGLALDPTDPEKCMLALGHKNVMWRFDRHTGEIGCAGKTVTPKIEEMFCQTPPKPSTFQWTTVKVLTPGASGTLTVKKGTAAPVSVAVTAGTAVAMGLPSGFDQLTFSYGASSGPTTIEIEVAYTSDADQQICYRAKVLQCGPVFNEAVLTATKDGATTGTSRRVELGKALGPDCPELSGCLADEKVRVVCNGDGTFTVTMAGGGFAGSRATLASRTPGVTVSPPSQPWAPTTTWTISGAAPGRIVTLLADTVRTGGGERPGTDACCSGEIEVVMPECETPKIDVGIAKKQIKADGQGIAFEIDVTNVGAPITFAATLLTVKDVVPPGMTITAQTDPNWSCLPLPAVGPATISCTYLRPGSLGTGAPVPDPIVLQGILADHEQPSKNCAVVSVAPAVGRDGNPANDRSCATVKTGKAAELIFTKRVVYEGPATVPARTYPIDVTCDGTTTTLPLQVGIARSMGNIGWGAACTYTEPTPPVPAGVCPRGTVGTWTTVFAPPSPLTIAAPTTHITVTNTLTCVKKDGGGKIDFGIEKTGGTTPAQAPPYQFTLKVTNHGDAVTSGGVIAVTDTVPANMTLDSVGGSGWTCAPTSGGAGTVITCVYGAAAASGEVLPPITVSARGKAPYPPVTNCADVAPGAGTGLVDGDPSNDHACVTVRKPTPCRPPLVPDAAGECVQPRACPPPMVPGAVLGQCLCPEGTVRRGDECVKAPTPCVLPLVPGPTGRCILPPPPPPPPPPSCRPPMVPGLRPGQCVCPEGTTLRRGECVTVKPPSCRPPMVPGVRPGQCLCPEGTTLRRGECVRVTVCKPPMVPGRRPGQCLCPEGTTPRNGQCVAVTTCRPPMVPGPRPGQCLCPAGTQARGGRCIDRIERPRLKPDARKETGSDSRKNGPPLPFMPSMRRDDSDPTKLRR